MAEGDVPEELVNQLKLICGPTSYDTDSQWAEVLKIYQGTESQLNRACATIWQMRAGRYHTLVTTGESGSTRQLSDLHKNALDLAKYYSDLAAKQEAVEEEEAVPKVTRTRRIVRP